MIEELTAARKRQGISQTELAKRLDITQERLSRWERGRSHPGNWTLLSQWARALGRKIDIRLASL